MVVVGDQFDDGTVEGPEVTSAAGGGPVGALPPDLQPGRLVSRVAVPAYPQPGRAD